MPKTRIHPVLAAVAAVLGGAALAFSGPAKTPSFGFERGEFVLNGKPFQMMAGEIHFQRIPRAYWADRLVKQRAAGLNTVCTYVFWNAIEPEPGRWDFTEGNDLAAFIRTAQRAGLWVVVRPGPYACAEWDFGGLPAWLLRTPDIKVRCSDSRYLEACQAYIGKVAAEIAPLQIQNGGPVLMLQIENEYGSYGNDRAYLTALEGMWREAGIDVALYTADGATPYMLEAGTVRGAAVGLDPGTNAKAYETAAPFAGQAPVFCSEFYPGWLTHWGEKWARVKTEDILPELEWLLTNRKSFNFYMFHGGTNFGFMAGANFSDKYEPDVTSYDYDAPLDEAGRPTPKYEAIHRVLARHQPKGTVLPALPAELTAVDIPDITLAERAGLFENLPEPLASPQPKPMEAFGQGYGFILYRTALVGHHSGKLTITELHDYANIYVDGRYIGTLNRAAKEDTIEIPKTDPPAKTLEILVEAMGRINFGARLIDRKGITERVTLNGMTLMNWETFLLPMDEDYLADLKYLPEGSGGDAEGGTGKASLAEAEGDASGADAGRRLVGSAAGGPGPRSREAQAMGAPETARPAVFFRGTFELKDVGDTFLDMSGWKKGVVWVNGNNLGRYWEIGPQTRLFCPAPFLKQGKNEIVVFDLHALEPAPIRGRTRSSE